MKLLLDNRNLIIFIGANIAYGIWDEPNAEKWRINTNLYAIDNGFTLVEVENVPSYVIPEKYFYINNEFVLNPNYSNPSKTLEELQTENEELKDRIATQEEQLIDTQLALTEQYETNLILEDEMLNVQMALVELYEGMEV